MGKKKPTVQSIARELSASYKRQQKADIQVTFKGDNPAERLRPGRHLCECQARVHDLIRNCLNCGRVVCAQEGSGPCFFCGELVCTREEREILNQRSRKSKELYEKLMAGHTGGGKKSYDMGGWSASNSKSLSAAEAFRNKLLIADADTERRTRVFDFESDYYDMDNDIFLTNEEKAKIKARKEELKEQRERLKRSMVVNFDFANVAVTEAPETKQATEDPIIKSILEASRKRQSDTAGDQQQPKADWLPPNFVPKYDERLSHQFGRGNAPERNSDDEDDDFYMLSDELQYAAIARKGYAIGVPQPYATLIAFGFIRNYPWHEEIDIRGPLLIVSKGKRASKDAIDHERAKYMKSGDKSRAFPCDFPPGVIVGRSLLKDCITCEEFAENQFEAEEMKQPFVLIFTAFEPLITPIPHLPTSEDLYRLDKQLFSSVKRIFDPYSL